jgi:IS4 transposase
VTNTPQILEKMGKAASRRMKAAFAKVEMSVLVELGLHNPVAAAVGLKGEGEWSLCAKLLGSLPKGSLLIVDRLYGCGKYLKELVESCRSASSEVLVRARGNIKSHKIEKLSDGSAMVSINLRKGNRVVGEIRIREIRARIKKPGSRKWSEVRLWTTLLDEKTYPANELLALYGFRWEHEIFYKELKIHMKGGDVLDSHTPETAAQEVAALLMACSILAKERSEAARIGKLQPLSISFVKTLERISSFWAVLEVSEGLLDDETKQEMLRRVRELIVREAVPKRRQRSCPRKVRQPVCGWPRLIKNESNEGDFTFEVVSFP